MIKNFYIPAVTLSFQDNVKLLQQLKPGAKCIINWNKYQSTTKTVIVWILKMVEQVSHTEHYVPKIQIRDCNIRGNLFDKPVQKYSNKLNY